ncbi:MAG: LysE family translocator [Frankiaceae bacterium]
MNYLSLIAFTITTCGTPGPNNTMVMASGANYGPRRSLPHVVGINVGFPLMVIAVGLGLGEVLHRWPVVYDVLRPVGVLYLLYLAYRIAGSRVIAKDPVDARPLSLAQSALFQVVNPKAWVMVVGAVTAYATADGNYAVQVVEIALVFLVLGTPCTVAWMLGGALLGRVVMKPAQFRAFNVVMASLLVLSLIPVLIETIDAWSKRL